MEDLITKLGLEHLSTEDKDKILVQIAVSLSQRLVVRVYDRLLEPDREIFDKLTEQGTPDEINSFLTEKIPDLDEIRDEEVEGIIEELDDFLTEARKK